MTIYIFDTDHLSLYGRSHPAILQKMQETNAALITTAIALAHNAILLTRNHRDFEKVPGIAIAAWSL